MLPAVHPRIRFRQEIHVGRFFEADAVSVDSQMQFALVHQQEEVGAFIYTGVFQAKRAALNVRHRQVVVIRGHIYLPPRLRGLLQPVGL